MSEFEPREWRLYIDDMKKCVDKIRSYTAGQTLKSFQENSLINDATLRNLEVLGEAANNIPLVIQSKNPQIPWRQIIGTRNKLIHGYLGIDDQIVWDIVCNEIPKLEDLLKNISI